MHANPTQSTVKVTLAGTEYSLLFDFEAIAEAERLTKRPLLTGLQPADIRTPTIDMVRAMLFACLHRHHPDLTVEQVAGFITRRSLPRIWGKVLDVWAEDLEPAPGDGPADPTPAQS